LAELQRKELYRSIESKEETLTQFKKTTEQQVKRYRRYFSICLDKDGKPVFKRNYDKINEAAKNCGFFCLLTNTELDKVNVLNKYRRRDVIEKGFDDVKNYIDMKRLRTHHTESTDGKLFCAFISLIIVSEILNKLGPLMKKRGWSKDSVFREMEKIRIVELSNGKRLMNQVTKSQRQILEAFGIGEDELRAYISREN
jgi:transposase